MAIFKRGDIVTHKIYKDNGKGKVHYVRSCKCCIEVQWPDGDILTYSNYELQKANSNNHKLTGIFK